MYVVDADAHVMESEATWDYLDPEWRAHRPVPLIFDQDTIYQQWNAVWLIEGRAHPKMAGRGWHIFATPVQQAAAQAKSAAIGAQTLTDVPARLADMDRTGIQVQVILPSLFLAPLAEDVRLEAALCRSYNRFLGQACAQSGGRLKYVAVLPWRDVAGARDVLREAHELGAVAAMAHGLVWDRPLGDATFDPVFADLSARGLPLVVHFGWGAPALNNIFSDRPSAFSGGLMPVVMAFYTMMAGGVFERFPDLRAAFLEAGSEWLPYALRRLHNRYSRGALPALRRPPADYLRAGNVYLACEGEEDVPYVLRFLGEDQIVMASDYPHVDPTSEDDMVSAIAGRADLTPAQAEKILSANPLRLYNLPVPAPVA
jgi:predicted TIM-barrel fold metal-dependent hydrolase